MITCLLTVTTDKPVRDRAQALPKQAPRARGGAGHEDFIQKIDALVQDFPRGRVSLSLERMAFLKDWLVEHIKGADKKYGPFLNKKGVS
jgi:hypothetical protein